MTEKMFKEQKSRWKMEAFSRREMKWVSFFLSLLFNVIIYLVPPQTVTNVKF